MGAVETNAQLSLLLQGLASKRPGRIARLTSVPTYHLSEGPSLQQLLARVATGDQPAFAELFHAWYPKIYEAGMLLTRSHEAAEEIVQDVFIKLWLKRETLPQINDFGAYLFTMARNQLLRTLEREAKLRRITATLASTTLSTAEDPETVVMDKHYRVLLDRAIQQLPERQQQVYRLARQQGLKREEVAAELQIGTETVKEHLAKATRNIRAYLQAHADALPPGTLLVLGLWLECSR